jgi:PKD repeat protein
MNPPRVPSFRRSSRARSLPILSVGLVVLTVLISMSAGASGRTAPAVARVDSSHAGGPYSNAPLVPSVRPPDTSAIPNWVNVTPTLPGGTPPAAEGGSSAYDPLDGETVYFGGCAGQFCLFDEGLTNQTWVFAHGEWLNETNPTDAPPARFDAAMDYDANMGAILLFGGLGTDGPLNDTWTFSGGVWTNVSYFGAAPPPLFQAAMAFDPDPAENGSVLFGGCIPVSIFDEACTNDTWVWQGGAGWVLLATDIAPPAMGDAAMAFDAADDYLLMFGGGFYLGGSDFTFDQTWELYSGQWWTASPPTEPIGLLGASMVYAPSMSSVLMFGGYNISVGYVNDSWSFSSGNWTALAPAAAPPPGFGFALSLDGTGATPLLVGGEDVAGVLLNATWAFEVAPSATVTANRSPGEVAESLTFTAGVGGGTSPFVAAFNFGDGTNGFVPGAGPNLSISHVYDAPGVYPVSVDILDAVGAFAASPLISFHVTLGPAVAAQAAPAASDVGVPISFASTVLAAGVSPLTYAWDFEDGVNATTANATHAFGAAGTYAVQLDATDADGAVATASVSVVVAPDPAVTLAAAPVSPTPGGLGTYFANVTGGTGPYTYAWEFGDGNTSALPAPQHTFAVVGTYTVQVWANDSVGESAHALEHVTVASASAGATGLAAVPWWFWAGAGGLITAGVVGSILLLRRGKS